MVSRRRLTQLGAVSLVAGLAGCGSLPVVGTIGFRFRNYRIEPCNPRIHIEILDSTVLDREYELQAGSADDPYSRLEPEAVSNIPAGVNYTATLFLGGEEVRTVEGTADCVGRGGEFDEELDIYIGYGRDEEIMIGESEC